MKKNIVFLMALGLVLSSSLFSQDNKKIYFAGQAGINFQNMTGTNASGEELDNSITTGFHAGVNASILLAPDIYFQPGLLFSQKGASNTLSAITYTTKVNYLDIPLNVFYRAKLGEGFVMLGFGPYMAVGLSGKVVAGDMTFDVAFTNTVELSDPLTTTYIKSFDAGAGIFAGFETSMGIYLQLNTQYGLIGINPVDKRILITDESSLKNVGFGLSAGYRF